MRRFASGWAAGDDEVEHRGSEGGQRDACRARSGPRNEGEVEPTFEEGFDQALGAGGGGAGLQEHAGMTPVEFTEEHGKVDDPNRGYRAQSQCAAQSAADLAHRVCGLPGGVESGMGAR